MERHVNHAGRKNGSVIPLRMQSLCFPRKAKVEHVHLHTVIESQCVCIPNSHQCLVTTFCPSSVHVLTLSRARYTCSDLYIYISIFLLLFNTCNFRIIHKQLHKKIYRLLLHFVYFLLISNINNNTFIKMF